LHLSVLVAFKVAREVRAVVVVVVITVNKIELSVGFGEFVAGEISPLLWKEVELGGMSRCFEEKLFIDFRVGRWVRCAWRHEGILLGGWLSRVGGRGSVLGCVVVFVCRLGVNQLTD